MAPKVRFEVPSYRQAKKFSVELRVDGDDALDLLRALSTKGLRRGPPTVTATIYPFAAMSKKAYTEWVAELLRQKLSEHWLYRW